MWAGMWFMCPASGQSVASVSAEAMARSGAFDISSAWMRMWAIAGCCGRPVALASAIDRSQTAIAPTASERLGRRPGFDIPQPARGRGDEGFGEQRHDVMVVGIIVVPPPHFGRVIIVPAVVFLGGNGMRLLKAARERLSQPIVEAGGVRREGAPPADVVIGEGDRRRSLPLAE